MEMYFTKSNSYCINIWEMLKYNGKNWYENAVLGFEHCNSWKPKMSFTSQTGTISRAFQTVLAVQKVRFFFFSCLIMSYRKKPVKFLITEHFFFEKSDLGMTLLYSHIILKLCVLIVISDWFFEQLQAKTRQPPFCESHQFTANLYTF